MSAVLIDTSNSDNIDYVRHADETSQPGDDLTLLAGVSLSNRSITLTAGDNALISGSAIATGNVIIAAGVGDLDGIGMLTVEGETRSGATTALLATSGIVISGHVTAPFLDIATLGGGVSETASGVIAADRMRSFNGLNGNVSLTAAANTIAALGYITVTGGSFALNDAAPVLTIDGPLSASGGVRIVESGTIVHQFASAAQKLVFDGSTTLGFNGGETTFFSSTTATAAQLQDALNALPGSNDAIRVAGQNGSFTITFTGPFAATQVPLITTPNSVVTSISITPAGDSTISGPTVTLIADAFDLQGGLITAPNEIVLAPLTAGRAVALGDFVTAGFALSAAELATLSAPTVTIGRHDGITTAGTVALGTLSIDTLRLDVFSLGGVTAATNAIALRNGSGVLNVTAGDTVDLGGLSGMTFDVGAISGSTTHGAFRVVDITPLVVDAISTAGGEIMVQSAGGELTINGALTSHGGNILAAHTLTSDNLVLNADIDAGTGAIGLLQIGGNVVQSGGRLIGAGLLALGDAGGSVTLDSADNAVTGRVALSGHQISFTNTSAYMLAATSVAYPTFGLGLASSSAAILSDSTGSVTLTTGGSITQGADVGDLISTGTLNLECTGTDIINITLDNQYNRIDRLGTVHLNPGGILTLSDILPLTVAGPVNADGFLLFGSKTTLDGNITGADVQIYSSSITQHASSTIDSLGVLFSGLTIEIDGTITTGFGRLTFASSGTTTINSALSNIGSLYTDALGLTVINGGAITTRGAQTYHDDIKLGAATVLTSTAGGITSDHAINNAGFDLTLNVATASSVAGVISGSGRLIKEGAGALTLAAHETYGGQTLINAGALLVDGALDSSLVTVASGGTLGGHGTVGALFVTSGGTLAAGDGAGPASTGVLHTGDVALFPAAHLAVELGGTAAGAYDQIAVHGGVTLGAAVLDVTLVNGFTLAAGENFTLIDNDGSDAVGGTFAGLAEGALLNLNGTVAALSYHGGDGNDVTLSVLSNHAPVNTVPGAQSVTTGLDLAIGGLSIADQDAGNGTMTTTLSVAHGTLHAASGHAAIAGDGSATLTLTGTLADINATLGASVTYHGASGFLGTDTLTMTTSDNGHTGLPGALTDTDTVKINVALPTQAPVIGTDGDDSFTAPSGNSSFTGRGGTDSITFDFRLVDATITYAGNQIIVDGPGGLTHAVLNGIEIFKFTDGTVNDADGNPLVDDLFYYATYHDVWNAHADADAHFNAVGWKEGRDPNAFFSTSGYLAAYTDVKAAGVNPLTHYDQFGWQEGRDPSGAFDTHQYLAHNGDVAAAHIDPLAHFLANGAQEGRLPYGDGVFG